MRYGIIPYRIYRYSSNLRCDPLLPADQSSVHCSPTNMEKATLCGACGGESLSKRTLTEHLISQLSLCDKNIGIYIVYRYSTKIYCDMTFGQYRPALVTAQGCASSVARLGIPPNWTTF